MLPFLSDKKKSIADLIVAERKPDEDSSSEPKEENHGLMAAAEELISAVHSKDTKAVMEALRSAHELMNSDSQE